MPTQKQRKRKSKRQLIDPADVAAGLREGLTQGVPISEINRQGRGEKIPSGLAASQHMNTEKKSGTAGVPTPHFVGRDSITGFIRQSPDGRKFADAELTFTPDVLNAIRAGMICLKCLEPQEYSFEGAHVPGCEGVQIHGPHYMRDYQIIDLAMEFEGETHIGPAKPLAEHEAEVDERRAKRKFDLALAQGRSPMTGLKH